MATDSKCRHPGDARRSSRTARRRLPSRSRGSVRGIARESNGRTASAKSRDQRGSHCRLTSTTSWRAAFPTCSHDGAPLRLDPRKALQKCQLGSCPIQIKNEPARITIPQLEPTRFHRGKVVPHRVDEHGGHRADRDDGRAELFKAANRSEANGRGHAGRPCQPVSPVCCRMEGRRTVSSIAPLIFVESVRSATI